MGDPVSSGEKNKLWSPQEKKAKPNVQFSLFIRVGTKLTILNMHAVIRICTQVCILNVSLKTDVNTVHA